MGVERYVGEDGRPDLELIGDSLLLMPTSMTKPVRRARVEIWSRLHEVLDEGWKLMIPASIWRELLPLPRWTGPVADRIRVVPDLRHAPKARKRGEVPVVVVQHVQQYVTRNGRRIPIKVAPASRVAPAPKGAHASRPGRPYRSPSIIFPKSWSTDALDRRAHLRVEIDLSDGVEVEFRTEGAPPGPKPLRRIALKAARQPRDPDTERWTQFFRRSPVAEDIWIGDYYGRDLVAIAKDIGVPTHSMTGGWKTAAAFLDGGIVSARRDGWGGGMLDGQYVIGSECAAWLCRRLDLTPTPRLGHVSMPSVETKLLHQIETGIAALQQASMLLCVASAQDLRIATPKAKHMLDSITPPE